MALRLYNTLTRQVEPFAPLDAASGAVAFYSCGPTVYDYAHIGNFRAFLTADLLRRWLESPLCQRADARGEPIAGAFGYRVKHVMNITDVGHMTQDDALDGGGEDRMAVAGRRLAEAKKAGALPSGVDVDPSDPCAIADFYLDAFKRDARVLGLRVAEEAQRQPGLLPRATEHIGDMLEIIADLLDKTCAYVADDGAVYFDIQAFPEYGALSGNTLERLRAGAGGRVADAAQTRKKHPADFLLWKPDPAHLMRWKPEDFLGKARADALNLREGYPGWHLECSAMALKSLAADRGVIDIHSGGEDNIFPHHECEIAQSRCYTGQSAFARCWLHARHLFVEGAKMSKSAGNFYTLHDLFSRGFSPGAIRLELIRTHYRSNANFTEQGLRDAERMLERWRLFLSQSASAPANGSSLAPVSARARDAFAAAMNDDLNVAGAIGVINAWLAALDAPAPADADLLGDFDAALGVLERPSLDDAKLALDLADGAQAPGELCDEEIQARLAERAQAREARDFATADRIRDELAAAGVEIKDTPKGATWRRIASL